MLEKKSSYQIKGIDVAPYSTTEFFYSDISFNINSAGAVKIGKGTYINKNTLIIAEKEVVIGRECKISWDVIIMDTVIGGKARYQPVVINDNVSIGSNCVILKEVTIGEGAIIAAGSVVTKDVPAFTIYGGTPARYIADIDQPIPRFNSSFKS
ncbi:MAG: acyltransferase [Balneolaceae bacterium]